MPTNPDEPNPQPKSELILYQTEDGGTRLEVRMEGETVWLTQGQMAELFQTSVPNVSMHIRNVFQEGELQRPATVKEFLTVQREGNREVRRALEHFNLDEKFRVIEASKPSPVEMAFDEAVAKAKQLQQGTPKPRPRKR